MGESRPRRIGRASLPVGKPGRGYEQFIRPDEAHYDAEQKGQTTPVGSFPANGYGLYDMAGNVWEWCWDWFETVGTANREQRTRIHAAPTAAWTACTAAAAGRTSPGGCGAQYRNSWHPSDAVGYRGFRLAGGQAQAAELDEGGERGSRDETPGEPPESSGAVSESRRRFRKSQRSVPRTPKIIFASHVARSLRDRDANLGRPAPARFPFGVPPPCSYASLRFRSTRATNSRRR